MEEIVKTTAERLNEILSIRNIKPVELHEKTGISKPSISQYMSGKVKPKQDRIYTMAKALEVNPVWLMGYDVPMEERPSSMFSLSSSNDNLKLNLNEIFQPEAPSKQDPPDLTKFLQQSEIMFDGDTYNLNDADREKIQAALRLAFWDAKKQNKRKKD